MPVLPEADVVGAGQLGEHGVGAGFEPFDQAFEMVEIHRGAAGGAVMLAAPDVEENFAAGGVH